MPDEQFIPNQTSNKEPAEGARGASVPGTDDVDGVFRAPASTPWQFALPRCEPDDRQRGSPARAASSVSDRYRESRETPFGRRYPPCTSLRETCVAQAHTE